MNKNMFKTFLFLIIVLSVSGIIAQEAPSPGRTPPPGVPIDGGLFALFAVAVGYAAKKLRLKK